MPTSDQHAGSAPASTAPPERLATRFDRRRSDPLSVTGEQRVTEAVIRAFAPLDKAALGIAVGLVVGVTAALVTIADLVIDPHGRAGLYLLSEYFYGYTVSPAGALVALGWGLLVGFVAGWFLAFVRNAVMAVWLLYFRARAEWNATDDFLDYI